MTAKGEIASASASGLDKRGAELLFQADPRLCAAIVDRLTFNGAIIETGTDSYRLAEQASPV